MPYFFKVTKTTIATAITSTVTINIIMIGSTMARVGLPVVEIGPNTLGNG